MTKEDFYNILIMRYKDGTATIKELEAFFILLKKGVLDDYLSDSMAKDFKDIFESGSE